MRSAPQTFETKGDASRYLATIEVDLLQRRYIDPRSGRTTFAAWVEMWLERTGKKRNSVARDRQGLGVFMGELGPRPLASITPMHVQAGVDARAKLAAPATVARDFSALRAVFNAAVDADIIGRSPCRRISLPRVRPPRRTTITPGELDRLAAAVPPRYRALILVAGVLGLRWGERWGCGYVTWTSCAGP